jgi:outer membrane protein W
MKFPKRKVKAVLLPGLAVVAASAASLAHLPQAQAELVYEDQPTAAQTAKSADDRAALRGALSASEKAKATAAAEAAAPPQTAPIAIAAPAQALPVAAPAPVAVQAAPLAAPAVTDAAAAPAPEVQNLSKSELLRRERVREELRNEDTLQERLEELRLRDEKKRTEQLIQGPVGATVDGAAPQAAAVPAQAPAANSSIQQEVIVAPVTDHPGKAAATPQLQPLTPTAAVLASPQGPDAPTAVITTNAAPASEGDKTMFTIKPQAGIANLSSSDGYDLHPHFSVGGGLAVEASNYITFEANYTYSEYGVDIASVNPFANYYQSAGGSGLQTLVLKQNVFDAGLKFHLLGQDSRVRPFIGGGGGYSKSYMNYNQNVLNLENQEGYQAFGKDYESSSYMGYLSTGLDIKVTHNISVGLTFKYYAVLSSSEDSLNNTAFLPGGQPYGGAYGNGYGYGGGYGGYGQPYGAVGQNGYNATDYEKQVVGGSLALSSFYTLMAGVNFTF